MVIGRHGWFRDELYYIACGERLDIGYVDPPPLIALVARATRELGIFTQSYGEAGAIDLLGEIRAAWPQVKSYD